ncbi:hypothetical protein D3C76_1302610 [compost metagenome]
MFEKTKSELRHDVKILQITLADAHKKINTLVDKLENYPDYQSGRLQAMEARAVNAETQLADLQNGNPFVMVDRPGGGLPQPGVVDAVFFIGHNAAAEDPSGHAANQRNFIRRS